MTVKTLIAVLALPLLAAAGPEPVGAPLVAADRALEMAARQSGEWTAFRAAALPQTELFVPQRVRLLEFGRGQADPAVSTRWKPQQVWTSCDLSVGVTFGKWWLPGTRQHGWYETVWVRTRGGGYRILLRRAGPEQRKLYARPGLKGVRAACAGRPPLPIAAPAEGIDRRIGASGDQTLVWTSSVDSGGAVRIEVAAWDGTAHVPVLEDVAPRAIAR